MAAGIVQCLSRALANVAAPGAPPAGPPPTLPAVAVPAPPPSIVPAIPGIDGLGDPEEPPQPVDAAPTPGLPPPTTLPQRLAQARAKAALAFLDRAQRQGGPNRAGDGQPSPCTPPPPQRWRLRHPR